MISCAFKTAPTDSIILISNLLPLDLRVIEIAAHRLLSSQNDHSFASSSRATIASLLPFLNSSHKLEPVFRARLALHPPWTLSSRVTILPPTLLSLDPCCPGTLKLFVQNHHNNLSAGFAVVTLDHFGLRDIVSSSLSSTASHRQVACFSLSKALDIVERTKSLFSSFEIYLTERYFIYAPGSKLTEASITITPPNSITLPKLPQWALRSIFSSPLTQLHQPSCWLAFGLDHQILCLIS